MLLSFQLGKERLPWEKAHGDKTQRVESSSAVLQSQTSQIHGLRSYFINEKDNLVHRWATNLNPICHHLFKLSFSDGVELWAGREVSWLKLLTCGLYGNFWPFQSSSFPCEKPRYSIFLGISFCQIKLNKHKKAFASKSVRLHNLFQYWTLWAKDLPHKLGLRKTFCSGL